MSGIDPKLFNQISQLGHFAGGAAIVLAGAMFHREWVLIGTFVGLLILAGLKEFAYDEYFETAEVRGSSLEDFSFYALGGVLAVGWAMMLWLH